MSKKIDRSLTSGPPSEQPLSKIENTSIYKLDSLSQARRKTTVFMPDQYNDQDAKFDLEKQEKINNLNVSPLLKNVVTMLDRQGFDNRDQETIERLAFETNPNWYSSYASIFIPKRHLIPDFLLKRLGVQNELVAAITRTRATQIGSFGRHQVDRFATGFRIQPLPGVLEKADKKQKEDIQKRITRAVEKLLTCGNTDRISYKEEMTLSQFLYVQARNASVMGRFATEIIWEDDILNGTKKFSCFRPVDVGTLFKAVPQQSHLEAVRRESRFRLASLKNRNLEPETFTGNEEFVWVQVIDGQPVQAMTAKECVVYDCYPCTDIEYGGYPVSPLDASIVSVTTFLNIQSHNKLYFQSGRASRGILVIQSEDIDVASINMIRQQFNNSINSVASSWRTPIFAISEKDKVSWVSIDPTSRDMEFSYLSDNNARAIFAAFHISPEEVPGWNHLSKGNGPQALSESNQEYKLEAARDVGIRPLLSQFQDFLNHCIFPLIDEDLSKICVLTLAGLDADTQERENQQLTTSAPLHMTYNEILAKVEKPIIPHSVGGDYPLNPQFQQVMDRFLTVGQQLESFFGVEGASKDPNWAYVRDDYWMNFQTMQLQKQQGDQQAQMAQQQAQQTQGQPAAAPQQPQLNPEIPDIASGVDQLLSVLGKSEYKNVNLSGAKKQLLLRHDLVIKNAMKEFETQSESLLENLTNLAIKHKKTKND